MQLGPIATDLRVAQWIDHAGEPLATPLRLADLGDGYRVIFCFQDWCPGCHSRGFPALQILHANLVDRGVGFAGPYVSGLSESTGL